VNPENKRTFDASTSLSEEQPQAKQKKARHRTKKPHDQGLSLANVVEHDRKRTKPQRFDETDQLEFHIPQEKTKKMSFHPIISRDTFKRIAGYDLCI
jgi:hypothetical protein